MPNINQKDSYYFPHDSNASRDPKILQIRSKWGVRGYAWYFMLIEMMREQADYKLQVAGDLVLNSYVKSLEFENKEQVKEFIEDCISVKLFVQQDGFVHSESLLRRMKNLDKFREQRRQAAITRWSKEREESAKNDPDRFTKGKYGGNVQH